MDIGIIRQVNGKLTVMSGPYEIVFQRKGNGVKKIYFQCHNEGTENFVPKKYYEPARKEAIKILSGKF